MLFDGPPVKAIDDALGRTSGAMWRGAQAATLSEPVTATRMWRTDIPGGYAVAQQIGIRGSDLGAPVPQLAAQARSGRVGLAEQRELSGVVRPSCDIDGSRTAR